LASFMRLQSGMLVSIQDELVNIVFMFFYYMFPLRASSDKAKDASV
jgi:hypothetical protein